MKTGSGEKDRHSGYIVQPFVVGQDSTLCFDDLQRISGRRVVTLEPWLHAGSTLQHVFWSACEGSDVAVFLIPEGILGAASFELPCWARITTELLAKLNSPVLLCTSLQDSLEDIQHAAKTLPPSLLLHMSAENGFSGCVPAAAALQAVQAEQADCRLLGSLPEVAFESAVATLHSEQATAEPLRAVVAAAIKHRTLLNVMGHARPQDHIPQPTEQSLHYSHGRSGIISRSLSSRVRMAVGVDMGLAPSQFQGNLNVLESLGCELTNVSMVTATCLPPDISGLYLSASLTPSAAYSLSINVSMRLSVAAFAAAGGVIYAEEAGLAYLASSVRFAGDTFGMAGVLPMHVIMHEEKQARSYVRLRVQPPPQDQEPLLHPGEWMRGVADTTLEVREEVATRGLSLRTRHISDMKVSQLFEAVLVDVSLPSDVHASGSGAKKNESDQSHKVRASPVHGFDTVREGYMQSKVAATLVHVCFASQASAVQPLVAACAALDSQSLTAGAAQHIANSQRSNSSSRTSSVRMRKSLPQSGSEGCLTQLAHPLVRLSGDHSPPSPRYLTPSASAVSMNFSLSPGLDRASNGARQSRSLPRALGLPPVTPAAGCGHGDSDVSRGMSMGHDSMSASGGGNQPRPGWGAPGIARWGSIPESLFQGQQGAPPPQSQGGSAPGSHSTMRSAAQWWMPPQPLPRVRVLSGRDLTVYDAGTRLPEASGSRQSRSSGAMDCAAAALHHSTNRHNSEERSAPAPAATSTGDILGLSKEPSCSSSSSVHSLSLQERGATSSHCQHTGVRSQIAALSPSIADILHHLGLGNTLGGVPADCTAAKPHIRDRDWSHSHSLARTSAGSSSAGAGGSGAVRTVISLVNNLTDSPAVNGHSHTYPASQKPGNKQLHRRASSGDSKASLGAWRNVARRVVMDVRDWQPLHVLHTDQIAALVAPMVLTWEPERCFSSKRGGVLPAIEAAHAGVLEHLRHMEVPVDIVTLPAPRCIGDMYSTVQCMGTILRATAAAEATTAHMRAGMHRLAQLCFRPSLKPAPSSTSCAQLQQRQQPRKVVMLRSAAPYIVAGGWLPELVRMSGATYACVFPGEGALGVEWSDIAAQEPDVIIVVVEMVGVQSAALELAVLAEEPGWWSLKATRNREVYVVDASHLLQVGPGVVNAAETVVRMCRPDLRGELGDSESRGDRDDRVLKLEMTAGQRCRPSLLPSFFTPVPW